MDFFFFCFYFNAPRATIFFHTITQMGLNGGFFTWTGYFERMQQLGKEEFLFQIFFLTSRFFCKMTTSLSTFDSEKSFCVFLNSTGLQSFFIYGNDQRCKLFIYHVLHTQSILLRIYHTFRRLLEQQHTFKGQLYLKKNQLKKD